METDVLKATRREIQGRTAPEPDWSTLETLTLTLKRNMLRTVQKAQTGHLGACCSSTELMAALYFTDILRYDSDEPRHPDRDLVLVRGHLGPLRYNLFSMIGWMKPEEMSQYREFGSRLCGHEEMSVTPGVDITPSGSLGMLLSYAVGACTSFKRRGLDRRVFCFLGDGEEEEGNVAEAARHGAHLAGRGELEGLIAIIDRNRKQLSTSLSQTDGADLERMWRGYGWRTLPVDGHDVRAVYATYRQAVRWASTESDGRPVCIIAETVKGNGVPGAEAHYCGYHVFHHTSEDDQKNRMPIEDAIEAAERRLEGKTAAVPRRTLGLAHPVREMTRRDLPTIEPEARDERVTSYEYLNEFLRTFAPRLEDKLYVLTADYPPRDLIYGEGMFSVPNVTYVNTGLREQHTMAMAHGIRTVEPQANILILCGDPFFYRSADQLNALAQAGSKVVVYSVQAGLSGAKNGTTHQSSGQSGVALTMPGVRFFEPSSKRDWFYVMHRAFRESGPTYVRTHKLETPFDFGGFEEAPFYRVPIGDGVPAASIVSNGMVIGEAVEAARRLHDEDGVDTHVINVLEPKRVDGIGRHVVRGCPLLVLYNGSPQVLSGPVSTALLREGVHPSTIIEQGFDMGRTGSIADLLRHFGLDQDGIYKLAKQHVSR